MPFSALPLSALLPSVCACLSFAARYPSPPSYDYPSPPSYDYPSPPSYRDYDYSTRTQYGTHLPPEMLQHLIWIIIVAAHIFIQFVAMCIAYWAFQKHNSCDCCYENAGVPNCPSAQPVCLSSLALDPLRRHTIKDWYCWQ